MNNRLEYTPSLRTEVAGTGGAGDAFLSGMLIGICCGLPLHKNNDDRFFAETPLRSAVELGALLASLSVTSPDTIHRTADANRLLAYAREKKLIFSHDYEQLFSLCEGS